jgi:hypothetical protein
MKKIDESAINGTVGMPIKSGVLQHLQDAIQDATLLSYVANLGLGINPANPAPTLPTILWKVYDTSGGGTFNCTDGILMYQGELFYLPATTFAITATPVVCLDIQYNNLAANADPVLFTDSFSRRVLQTRQLSVVDGSSATSGYICDFSSLVVLPYEQGVEYDQSNSVTIGVGGVSTLISTLTLNTRNAVTIIQGFVNVFKAGGTGVNVYIEVKKNGTIINFGQLPSFAQPSAVTTIPFTFIENVRRNDVLQLTMYSGGTPITVYAYNFTAIQTRA